MHSVNSCKADYLNRKVQKTLTKLVLSSPMELFQVCMSFSFDCTTHVDKKHMQPAQPSGLAWEVMMKLPGPTTHRMAPCLSTVPVLKESHLMELLQETTGIGWLMTLWQRHLLADMFQTVHIFFVSSNKEKFWKKSCLINNLMHIAHICINGSSTYFICILK